MSAGVTPPNVSTRGGTKSAGRGVGAATLGRAGAAGLGGGGIGAAAPRGSMLGMYGIDGDGAS
jgi:hypothetical protein